MSRYNRGDLFTDKVINLYGYTKDVLDDILQNRKMYDESPESFPTEIELLRIYDLYKEGGFKYNYMILFN